MAAHVLALSCLCHEDNVSKSTKNNARRLFFSDSFSSPTDEEIFFLKKYFFWLEDCGRATFFTLACCFEN
jgi:hypothetical protein